MLKMIKKIRNYFILFFKILFVITFKLKPWAKNIKIINIIKSNFANFHYISNKLKFIYFPKKKIGKYFIDSSLTKTDLCSIGERFQTDKSPYNTILHRHPYTSVYELFFSNLRYKKINFAEIGILNNSSIRTWRNYFKHANIFAFEFDKNLIRQAKKDNLKNVIYQEIDVTDKRIISKSFKSSGCIFDVIVDDSTHTFNDQINIIEVAYKYLSPGGILVIEDIPRTNKDYSEEKFSKRLTGISKYFSFINFIECEHINRFSKGWDNDKMLVLIRNSLE